MKKTVALIIALCFVVLACVPSIPSRAASLSDISLRTSASVANYWDDSTLDTIQERVVNYNGDFIDSYYDKIANLPEVQGYSPCMVQRFIRSATGIAQYTLLIIFVDNNYIDADFEFFFTGNGSNLGDFYCVGNVSSTPQSSTIMKSIQCTWQSNGDFAYSSASGYFYIYSGTSNKMQKGTPYSILWSAYPVYVNGDPAVNNSLSGSISVGDYFNLDRSSWHNFMNENLPYSDSEGNIVTPSSGDPEVNTALAFDVFNSQVVYNQINKTFTSANISWDLNPMGRTILETYPATEWDMKFTCQVTYNMSSYRPNNQTTPLQSYANGFTFTGTYAFEDYDSIMDGQIYGIDPIKGFETLSEAEIASSATPDCNLFFALLGAMKGNYASGNDNTSGKSGFALLGGTIVNNWTQFATTVGGFGSAIMHLEGFTGINGREWLEDHVSGDYIYMLDNFTMNVQAWFECGTIKSQSGYTDIDFVNHTTSSYAPKAYETEEGVTPTIPDPYTNTNDTPVEPGGLDANGVVVYVPVNVEVNVPSGGGDNTVTSGDNSIINNNNPTFNPVFNNNNENSVESLSDLIGEDAATANNGIGGFLDPFKNNSMVTLTGEYFSIVPEGLRTVLTAAIGILIILGIYRFIRRG